MSRLSPLASCAAITVLLYQATLVIAEITSASDMSSDKKPILVVAGGNGFIGSHVARRLHAEGHYVRIADIHPASAFAPESISAEVLVGNLCDIAFCEKVVRGAHTVFHFAAAMGGMGTIHSTNDFVIYSENHTMTQNLLASSVSARVTRFFYASSACVYPEHLQDSNALAADVSLHETDVFAKPPPKPQGLYGLEKLNSELLLHQYESFIQIRIARFHNIYGPRGAWRNGREKVPAALIRKVLAAHLLGSSAPTLEIWGDGKQRRSFLYIDDCVDAILLLMSSQDDNAAQPINIGSDRAVTINDLAAVTLEIIGVHNAQMVYFSSRPTGVSARNSNNEVIQERLGWRPRDDRGLVQGMRLTAEWMSCEIERLLIGLSHEDRSRFLQGLMTSRLVNLHEECITFAILLPITSRGGTNPEDCLTYLTRFAQSLSRTTWRDTHALGGLQFRVRIYLAIDEDDSFLLDAERNRAMDILMAENFTDIITLVCNFPPGQICDLWRECARRAWQDGCDYFVLMGDDVVLQDEGWMRDSVQEFRALSEQEFVPQGFGCVAFTDTSFPGMPTFPIIHRRHMDAFEGEIVPKSFVNQDGDPFLYQLYRRWNCSRMFQCRIYNSLGGSGPARYEKQHSPDWTYETLTDATKVLRDWLEIAAPAVTQKLTLDIVIPSFRVQISILTSILELKPSNTCIVMFIVIIDDPLSPAIGELEHRFAHRPDVRIRINEENLGASASRNRGIAESSAEWIYFLDDDVLPNSDLLIEAERSMRAHPDAAGFVGNMQFPVAKSVFTTAVHLAGVTYFWDIATKMDDDVPWGVTANLISRRDVKDNVRFSLQFPKTGGGEDIAFCRQKRAYSVSHGGEGFRAAPRVIATHPWWNNGQRSYWRFYGWSKGDGALVSLFPQLTYLDHAPNSAELFLMSAILIVGGMASMMSTGWSVVLRCGFEMAAAIFLGNIAHDIFRHLWRDRKRTEAIHSSLGGLWWVLAVLESSFIRMFSEGGRVVGAIQRFELRSLGRRFDWFAGRGGTGPIGEERMNSRQRLALTVVFWAVMHMTTY